MTVLLDAPLPVTNGPEASPAVGYIIVIGVNAPDMPTAVRYAHEVALRPRNADGSFSTFAGIVVEAQVTRIEKEDWEPFIRQNAKRIDQEGVYYSTGLVFFPAEGKAD
ncbi:MAG TPA: hypothetical protein VMP01_15075 [Pirellulaceae bacterium]|nr:hypothetical protein [Pirellulaceae bacterium]